MIDWFSKSRREQKKRLQREQQLKQSLADKVSQYQKAHAEVTDVYTEVLIGNRKLRVAKQQIDITDAGLPIADPITG